MKEVDFNTYKKLLANKSLSKSSMPSGVLKSDTFKGLQSSEILKITKVGRGLKVVVNKEEDFQRFFETTFPEQKTRKSKSGNIRKFRNSKATKLDSFPIFLFRGFERITINDELIDVAESTKRFGLFATTATSIICEKVCFVENLDTFLNAEKLLGREYLYVHKYGRIGADSLSIFRSKEVLVFVDYDFNGLDEYLRIKGVFANASLYMPKNYNQLFTKYSKTLRGNKAKMSKAVANSCDEVVIEIREQVARNNRFLEQEVLIYD